jgi:hypothetical protein
MVVDGVEYIVIGESSAAFPRQDVSHTAFAHTQRTQDEHHLSVSN